MALDVLLVDIDRGIKLPYDYVQHHSHIRFSDPVDVKRPAL